MSESTPPRCPRCNATVGANQEYCLECGARLADAQPGPLERTSAGIGQRNGGAAPWVVPALLGLVIAVLGTGAAIAISNDGAEPSAISTATGGSLTVTNDGSTLTAPEPTEPTTTTAPATTTAPKPTTTPKPPANPAAIVWPRDRRGWTIVLLSLPQSNGLAGANAKAAELRRGGPPPCRRPRLRALREPSSRLLRDLHRRLRLGGGGVERAPASAGRLPLHGVPARNHPVSVGISGAGQTRSERIDGRLTRWRC